jgi:hypothetical protein
VSDSPPLAGSPDRPRLSSRKYGKSGHAYYIDDVKVDGVTTILNALPKSLTQWAADQAAEEALNNWDELSQLPLTKRMDRIRYAHRETKNKAAMRGTEIHTLGERLYGGLPIEVPAEHRGPVEAYAKFLDAWDIQPIASETPLVNLTYRYGGTADLWANIGARDNVRALIDLKTGNNVYESTVLQLTGYRNADRWQPAKGDAKTRQASEEPLPPVDECWVAHILPDTVRFRPVRTEGQFRAFLYVQQVHKWIEAHGFKGDEPLIDEPQQPGGSYVFD